MTFGHVQSASCEGKVGYGTPSQARRTLSSMRRQRRRLPKRRRRRLPLHVYQCRFCRRWHLGRDPLADQLKPCREIT